jgi:hypothetical protein
MNARAELREQIFRIIDKLQEDGMELPEILKRRDKREPRRAEKEKLEDRIFMRVRRHFKDQRGKIQQRLEVYFASRKDLTAPLDDIFDQDDELVADLIRLITAGGTAGIEQFADKVGVQLDYTLTNTQAAEWARKYVFNLVKDIDETSVTALQNAIGMFVDTPGMTIGDVMNLLPFDEERARMIAVTETTRAYSKGQQLGADELAKEFPGVDVVQKWFTNQDDKVCEICGPLGDGEEIPYGETFYEPDGSNDGFPPAHVNCRCWTDYSTRIA